VRDARDLRDGAAACLARPQSPNATTTAAPRRRARWCTIEEARIWDIGLTETERFAHHYSPALAAMIGRLRLRLSQALSTVLSMSQRMQFELRRWHTAGIEQGEKLRSEEAQRLSLQQRVAQLQERVTSLEDECTLHAARGGDPHPLEKAFRKLQQENIRLSQQLRAAHAQNTSVRTSSLSLQLSNQGLLDELARCRAQLGEDMLTPRPHAAVGAAASLPRDVDLSTLTEPMAASSVSAACTAGGTSQSDTQPLLELFASYGPDDQRIALDALVRVHEALTGESVARGGTASSSHLTPPPAPPAVGISEDAADPAAALPPILLSRPQAAVVAPPPEERLLALEQLAETLSEEESQTLIRAVARRRAGLAATAAE
jgi:hypothetical protein